MKFLVSILKINFATDHWDLQAYLNTYICALSQNRSNKLYLFSFENIQNSPPNPVNLRFNNRIQLTIPLVGT